MGLFLLVALGIYAWLALIVFGGLIKSLFQCSTVPFYWLVASISAFGLPAFLYLPFRASNRANGGWVEGLIQSAVSGWSVLLFVGGLLCTALAYDKRDWVRPWSGVSWGLAAVLILRVGSAG